VATVSECRAAAASTLTDVTNTDPRETYRTAYADWQAQLTKLHAFFLEGERIPPQQIKGLLNREARAKDRYDEARRRLLGIEE
jgi:hypothetical protein